MKQRLFFVVLAVLAIAAVSFYFLSHSESRKVRKRFESAASAVSKEAGEGNIAMAFKMETLGNMLADELDIRVREYPFDPHVSGVELVSLVVRGRAFFETLSLKVLDVETEFITKEHANSRCSIQIRGKSRSDIYDEVRTFEAELKKTDGKWRFTVFHEGELLKR